MSRIGDFDSTDIVGWVGVAPELGTAMAGFTDAVYNRSRLPLRVREAARMAIALANECAVCQQTRDSKGAEHGIDDDFYDHVLQWDSWEGFSGQERIAAEFGHRFATDHTGLRDDEDFWDRAHDELSDELIADLALSCAMWLGSGRVFRVLDIGQTCKLTL
ncbi:carboxymuconolactone decarboxylase family protein [Gordonia sp. CPCC 205333]|uniref:carboxymuconolactone decarboxylase family protein n=1 Tax=Gordonia sp. CPCC 205333 TaxID=3140790 RepID=UPI003AF3D899